MVRRYDYQFVREYFLEGFSNSEIAIMYESTTVRIASITRGLERPERI